ATLLLQCKCHPPALANLTSGTNPAVDIAATPSCILLSQQHAQIACAALTVRLLITTTQVSSRNLAGSPGQWVSTESSVSIRRNWRRRTLYLHPRITKQLTPTA